MTKKLPEKKPGGDSLLYLVQKKSRTEKLRNLTFACITGGIHALREAVRMMDEHPFRFMVKFIVIAGAVVYIAATLHVRIDGFHIKVWDSWKEQLKMEEEYLARHRDDFFEEMNPRKYFEPDD